MPPKNLLEDFVAQLNANVFLREFAFSATELSIPGKGQLEIADHLVLLDKLGLIYQLKERDAAASNDIPDLLTWFEDKVRRKAVKQLGATHALLESYRGTNLVNERGHQIPISTDTINNLVNIVIYRAGRIVGFRPQRFYVSRSAGFVHFINDTDYFRVCRALITPTEIVEYFQFRQRVLLEHQIDNAKISESAFIGQYMAGDPDDAPDPRFERALNAQLENPDDWELSFITENLGQQIAYSIGDQSETSYYRILAQLAQLSRAELREFKLRLRLTLEAVRGDEYRLPYRMAVPRIDCGFLIFPVPRNMRNKARKALHNFTLASKHELQVTKHVGLSICKRVKNTLDLEWMYVEGENEPNPELDRQLEKNYPFRRTHDKMQARYFFDTDRLRKELGPAD
jgi:hypothetical protein